MDTMNTTKTMRQGPGNTNVGNAKPNVGNTKNTNVGNTKNINVGNTNVGNVKNKNANENTNASNANDENKNANENKNASNVKEFSKNYVSAVGLPKNYTNDGVPANGKRPKNWPIPYDDVPINFVRNRQKTRHMRAHWHRSVECPKRPGMRPENPLLIIWKLDGNRTCQKKRSHEEKHPYKRTRPL